MEISREDLAGLLAKVKADALAEANNAKLDMEKLKNEAAKMINETKTVFKEVDDYFNAQKKSALEIGTLQPEPSLFPQVAPKVAPTPKPVFQLELGKKYLFRTVTMIYTGLLESIRDNHFVITQAAWIPETLRWSESVKTGEFKEVEPYPADRPVFLFEAGMLDIVEIPKLPLVQK
jgi:hypothetical protein